MITTDAVLVLLIGVSCLFVVFPADGSLAFRKKYVDKKLFKPCFHTQTSFSRSGPALAYSVLEYHICSDCGSQVVIQRKGY